MQRPIRAGNGLDWTRADTIAYISNSANWATLEQEFPRTAGNDIIDGGDGDDVIFGQEGNDQITGGVGADMIDGGSGVDVLTGGTGNDTYSYASTAEVTGDNIVEAASGGTDTIRTTATANLIALTVNGAADLEGASSIRIEQILIQSGSTATFSGAQLTGNTIAINELAAAPPIWSSTSPRGQSTPLPA